MPVYAYILLASWAIPLLFSIFALNVIRDWPKFLLSTSIVAGFFLIWDACFTTMGIWGFNDDYCLGLYFLGMPIEEWSFFFVIPFCSLFIHFALHGWYADLGIRRNYTLAITWIIMVVAGGLLLFHWMKWYTLINFLTLIVILRLGLKYNVDLLSKFYISFLLILVPFFIVNGILTGSFVTDPIVWYNESEFMGIRIGTVPLEDIGYAFTMLFGNLLIYDFLGGRSVKITR